MQPAPSPGAPPLLPKPLELLRFPLPLRSRHLTRGTGGTFGTATTPCRSRPGGTTAPSAPPAPGLVFPLGLRCWQHLGFSPPCRLLLPCKRLTSSHWHWLWKGQGQQGPGWEPSVPAASRAAPLPPGVPRLLLGQRWGRGRVFWGLQSFSAVRCAPSSSSSSRRAVLPLCPPQRPLSPGRAAPSSARASPQQPRPRPQRGGSRRDRACPEPSRRCSSSERPPLRPRRAGALPGDAG